VQRATNRTATTHGLRASFKSWGEDVGIDHQVVECCLAHAKGDSTVAAYIAERWSTAGGSPCSGRRTSSTARRAARWWPWTLGGREARNDDR
jgi:hypothetical protein